MPTSADRGLTRLLTWLSPAFPVGSYSYSHAIEHAIEAGLVIDTAGLRTWIDSILRHGSGRTDAILLGEAWRAERDRDDERLGDVLAWAEAFREPPNWRWRAPRRAAPFSTECGPPGHTRGSMPCCG
jgi:urease accessory protein